MTDDDKALVEELKSDRPIISQGWEFLGEILPCNLTDRAADRIEALITEKEAVRKEERAAIVAWMMREEKEYPASEYSGFVAMIREEIEAGEHLK